MDQQGCSSEMGIRSADLNAHCKCCLPVCVSAGGEGPAGRERL